MPWKVIGAEEGREGAKVVLIAPAGSMFIVPPLTPFGAERGVEWDSERRVVFVPIKMFIPLSNNNIVRGCQMPVSAYKAALPN